METLLRIGIKIALPITKVKSKLIEIIYNVDKSLNFKGIEVG